MTSMAHILKQIRGMRLSGTEQYFATWVLRFHLNCELNPGEQSIRPGGRQSLKRPAKSPRRKAIHVQYGGKRGGD
jgi:hypothetical protein